MIFARQVLTLIFLTSSLLACQKQEEPKTKPLNRPFGEKQYYNESELISYTNSVSSRLGIAITIENPNDFSREHNVRRVLGILNTHAGKLIPHLGGVAFIRIQSSTQMTGSPGKYQIGLSTDIKESELLLFVTEYYEKERDNRESSRDLDLITGVQVIDQIGFAREDLMAVAGKLRVLASEVTFAQDREFRALYLADYFGIVPNGMIIDARASTTEIMSQIRSGIDARLRWNSDVIPLLTNLRLSCSYQPGVFTGPELNQVTALLESNAAIIKGMSRKLNRFLIGKRWEVDRSTGVVMIDFKVTDELLKQRLTELEPPLTDADFEAASAAILNTLRYRGFVLESLLMDVPRNQEGLTLLEDFHSQFVHQVDISYLKDLNVRTVHIFADQESTAFVPGGNTLYIRWPGNVRQIEQMLETWLTRQEFSVVRFDILNHSALLNVPLDFQVTESKLSVARMKVFKTWFLEKITLARRDSIKLKRITVTSSESMRTQFIDGHLLVSFEDFNPSTIDGILTPPTPPARPVP